MVMPPVDHTAAPAPAPAPKAEEPPAGDFTALFRRLETPGSMPAVSRPAPTPAPPPAFAAPSPQPPAPSPSWQAPPAPIAPANFAAPAPVAPLSGDVGAGPSEFTRILGKVAPPRPDQRPPDAAASPASGPPMASFSMPPMQLPQVPSAPAFATPAFQAPAVPSAPAIVASVASGPAPAKSYLPLIIALNVVLIIAVAIVLYVALKK
jgi:hypothetical protein